MPTKAELERELAFLVGDRHELHLAVTRKQLTALAVELGLDNDVAERATLGRLLGHTNAPTWELVQEVTA
jgi:hypothetical protein